MKYPFIFLIGFLFLISCENDSQLFEQNMEKYAGTWSAISVLSEVNGEIFGTNDFKYGSVIFEFTSKSEGNLLSSGHHIYKEYYLDIYTNAYWNNEAKFAISKSGLVIDGALKHHEVLVAEVTEDGKLHIYDEEAHYIFSK